MQPKMVTIATFESAVQAHIARNKLEAAGIVAAISNEAIATTSWQLTSAFGGIQLHVRADDAEEALKILEEKESIEFGSSDQELDEEPDEFTKEDFEAEPEDETDDDSADWSETEADRLAQRGFKAAFIGLLFPPLQLYAMWLLILFVFEPTPASTSSRWQVALAWLVSPAYLTFFLQFLVPVLPPPIP